MASMDSSNNCALALSHIVQELLEAYENGSTLNLTRVKSQAARKYKLTGIPQMADILQSIPLKETGKTISISTNKASANSKWCSSGGSHVETSSLSTHCTYGQCLHVLSQWARQVSFKSVK
jgi:histone acetyltransferase (RNA polymerase elongator complex component)